MNSQSVTIQMKATEQFFPVVLFIILYKVVLTFEFVDKILKCDHPMKAIKQYVPVVMFIIHAVKVAPSIEFVNEIDHSNVNHRAMLSLWCCLWPKTSVSYYQPFKFRANKHSFMLRFNFILFQGRKL